MSPLPLRLFLPPLTKLRDMKLTCLSYVCKRTTMIWIYVENKHGIEISIKSEGQEISEAIIIGFKWVTTSYFLWPRMQEDERNKLNVFVTTLIFI